MQLTSTNLSSLRILVSNDDSIHAPGIKILERIAQGISPDVWIVAPERNQSGVGHSISMMRPLRIRELSPRRFAVDGTPGDCIALALEHVLKDKAPDIILSGINEGANLADDVTYSGTLGAAMEGTFHGIKSIGFSLDCFRTTHPKWATVEHFAPQIIRKLLGVEWGHRTLMSINFPDATIPEIKGITVAEQGHHSPGKTIHPITDHWGHECFWVGSINRIPHAEEGTDLQAMSRNEISVTPLTMNMTNRTVLENLRTILE